MLFKEGQQLLIGIFPSLRVVGCPGFYGFAVADDLAQMLQIPDVTKGHSLGQQIANGSAFHRTGNHGTIQGIGDQLVKETVVDGATDDIQRIDTQRAT